MRFRSEIPFFVVSLSFSGLAMMAPCAVAFASRDYSVSRAFFYSSLILLTFSLFMAIATANRKQPSTVSGQLLAVTFAFILLPLFHLIPVYTYDEQQLLVDLYFEFVACLTTTGATVFSKGDDLPAAIHFWRAEVAWMGGLLIWASAVAIFRPLGLGGFETVDPGETETGLFRRRFAPAHELGWFVKCILQVLPLYTGVTCVLWGLLSVAGNSPLDALIHAMSTISTSGITAQGHNVLPSDGILGELAVFLFMVLAVSRVFVLGGRELTKRRTFFQDAEIRLAAFLIGCGLAASLIFGWQEFVVEYNSRGLAVIVYNCWGILFTCLSFLTTTGFESSYWEGSSSVAGFGFPSLVLLTLALVGGGIATTSGGIKLLRIYLLYQRCRREVERMIFPSALNRSSGERRGVRSEGASVAWIFFMLFVLSLALLLLMLTFFGFGFESAFSIAVAVLTTTGPLANSLLGDSFHYVDTGTITKLTLSLAMIVGRMETIVFVFLLGSAVWRK